MGSLEELDHLVRRCHKGDQEAFEAVFVQYQPRLRFYIRRLATSVDHTRGPAPGHWGQGDSKGLYVLVPSYW